MAETPKRGVGIELSRAELMQLLHGKTLMFPDITVNGEVVAVFCKRKKSAKVKQ